MKLRAFNSRLVSFPSLAEIILNIVNIPPVTNIQLQMNGDLKDSLGREVKVSASNQVDFLDLRVHIFFVSTHWNWKLSA